jgi:segregation and condensation protein A
MSELINAHILTIKFKDFDGPLDVLSELVQEKKMDVLKIDIVDIINQYIEFVNERAKEIEINHAIEYLNMLTYLLQLKSKRMLIFDENSPDMENFEYERDKLLQRIVQYNKYKRVCEFLRNKMEHRNRMFSKFNDDSNEEIIETTVFVEKLPEAIDQNALADLCNDLIERYRFNLFSKQGLRLKHISPQYVKNIFLDYLKVHKKSTMHDYLKTVDKKELNIAFYVVLFSVILDLCRFAVILIEQDGHHNVVVEIIE